MEKVLTLFLSCVVSGGSITVFYYTFAVGVPIIKTMLSDVPWWIMTLTFPFSFALIAVSLILLIIGAFAPIVVLASWLDPKGED